jgi:hypothetical protein
MLNDIGNRLPEMNYLHIPARVLAGFYAIPAQLRTEFADNKTGCK